MTRTRRGLLLIGLALVLGGLAASDVARREAALERRDGPLVDVAVARKDLAAGARVREGDLGVRQVPLRHAPAGLAFAPAELVGGRLAVPVPRGAPVGPHLLVVEEGSLGVRRGERAVDVVATGSPRLVLPGSRVDVLITREGHGTQLALQDVEVLAAAPAEAPATGGGPRIAATLRVRLRQALYLTEAQSFAREIRLLPRGAGEGMG
jgi:pilus assembly protein CpaB